MTVKHVLGLHTKEERQHAYSLAYRVYQHAMKAMKKGPAIPDYNYAVGYIDAIAALVKGEAPEDTELLSTIQDMLTELNTHHVI